MYLHLLNLSPDFLCLLLMGLAQKINPEPIPSPGATKVYFSLHKSSNFLGPSQKIDPEAL